MDYGLDTSALLRIVTSDPPSLAILDAMKADATNTAADTDTSSYRIDIGV